MRIASPGEYPGVKRRVVMAQIWRQQDE